MILIKEQCPCGCQDNPDAYEQYLTYLCAALNAWFCSIQYYIQLHYPAMSVTIKSSPIYPQNSSF